MIFRRICCVLLLLASSIPVDAAAPVPLQPTGKWDVNYGDTECTGVRPFGSASDPILFGIVPSLSSDTYELVVSVPKKGPPLAEELAGKVDFGRGSVKAGLLYFGAKGSSSSTYQYRISADDMQQARSAASVALLASGRDDYTFALSDMPALLDALQKCAVDLKQYWNLGGEKDGRIAASAVPSRDPRTLFSSRDYPGDALRKGQEGKVQYQLLVDEKGTVAGCHVLVASGIPVLDAMGCIVFRDRARFTPAADGKGKPVRSVVTTPPIVWRLGGPPPRTIGGLPPLDSGPLSQH